MKLLSTLAITSCSISVSLLSIASPAQAVSRSESIEGQLEYQQVDFYNFSNLDSGNLFTVEVNSSTFDPFLGQLDSFGNIIAFNDDQSDNNVLPILTGEIPTTGNLNFAVSGLRDIYLSGNHFESGLYTFLLKTFPIPSPATNVTLVNGDFATGEFTGWTTLGATSVETITSDSGSTQSNSQALLSTGGTTFDASILERFLGLKNNSLNDFGNGEVTKGSAIQQKFTAQAGDILSFKWNFFTNDKLPPLSFPDFSFVSISSSDNSLNVLLELANADNATSYSSLAEFFQETGFGNFSLKLPTTATYTLGLGVIDVGDSDFDSGLLVDDFQVTSVPESNNNLHLLIFSMFLVFKFWRKTKFPTVFKKF